MSKMIDILPFGGLNKRFPRHKIAGQKTQKVRELRNLMSLDGRIYLPLGGERVDSTAKPGYTQWSKRIYYQDGGDNKRFEFSVINGYMYRLNENNQTLVQMTIDNSLSTRLRTNTFPIDSTMKVSEQVSTFLVDGLDFYKFNGNAAGNWEKIPTKQDLDGNDIVPIYCEEYLDRLFVLVEKKNIIIVSANKNPELYNDSTDCAIISVPPGNGGFPQALIVHRGQLYIVHDDYFAPVSGSSISTFGVKPGDIIHGYGTHAPRSVLGLKTTFGFLNSKDNEYYTTGGTLDSTQKTPLSYDIKLSSLINPVHDYETVAHLDTSLNCIRISYVRTGEVLLNWEVIYSIDEEKWCGETADRNISCYSQWNGRGDQNELITGRSDSGLLMYNNRTFNWDGNAVHYKLVTADYVMSDTEEYQIEVFFIDALPYGNFGIPFAYYIDSRITTNAVESINQQGEIINLGLVEIADQEAFMNSAVPFIDKSKGRLIRFQIEETVSNRRMELYGIHLQVNKDAAVFDKLVSGR